MVFDEWGEGDAFGSLAADPYRQNYLYYQVAAFRIFVSDSIAPTRSKGFIT